MTMRSGRDSSGVTASAAGQHHRPSTLTHTRSVRQRSNAMTTSDPRHGMFLLQVIDSLGLTKPRTTSKEDLLQHFLARYPDLMAGHQIDPVNPRRWLLVDQRDCDPGRPGRRGPLVIRQPLSGPGGHPHAGRGQAQHRYPHPSRGRRPDARICGERDRPRAGGAHPGHVRRSMRGRRQGACPGVGSHLRRGSRSGGLLDPGRRERACAPASTSYSSRIASRRNSPAWSSTSTSRCARRGPRGRVEAVHGWRSAHPRSQGDREDHCRSRDERAGTCASTMDLGAVRRGARRDLWTGRSPASSAHPRLGRYERSGLVGVRRQDRRVRRDVRRPQGNQASAIRSLDEWALGASLPVPVDEGAIQGR